MPTRSKRGPHAPQHRRIDLLEAGRLTNYSPQYLRTMKWRNPDPPPLFKYRGRWHCYEDELLEWLRRRDGEMAG